MKNLCMSMTLIISSIFLMSCAVTWKTPASFAEVVRDSDELRVLKANGLMMKAKVYDNETPGGSEASLEFWSGNIQRSLRERGYHPVGSQLQIDAFQDTLWWSSWIHLVQGQSARYTVGMKVNEDKLLLLEASAIDSIYLSNNQSVMKFFLDTELSK
tara:strand:+ start:147 stop:617 length:471 start_codon:yes stop_codon:yes gene_type:complete